MGVACPPLVANLSSKHYLFMCLWSKGSPYVKWEFDECLHASTSQLLMNLRPPLIDPSPNFFNDPVPFFAERVRVAALVGSVHSTGGHTANQTK